MTINKNIIPEAPFRGARSMLPFLLPMVTESYGHGGHELKLLIHDIFGYDYPLVMSK